MKKYDKNTFSYGYEAEWGDVNRQLQIPTDLGSWEYSECDIVNERDPYKNIACDPLGVSPPFGGEINTVPTIGWQVQVDKIMQLKQFFIDNGCEPTAGSINHGHIHIHVPRLKEDPDALKRLVTYIRDNQDEAISRIYPYKQLKQHKEFGKIYQAFGGQRRMPEVKSNNLIDNMTDFNSFIHLFTHGAVNKDNICTPMRYAINLYSLRHINTVEFRHFRSSTNRRELESSFNYVELFMDAALNNGPSVKEILDSNVFIFPPMKFDVESIRGWMATKYGKDRGSKERKYVDLT